MVNIVEFNLDKLNRILIQSASMQRPRYLIMSRDTRLAIENMTEFMPRGLCSEIGGYREYHGIPVAECNKLPFGNIEIID